MSLDRVLLETGDFLLLETGDHLLNEDSTAGAIVDGSAALVGNSALVCVGTGVGEGAAALVGTSSLSAIPLYVALAKAALVGTSSLTAIGSKLFAGGAALIGTSALTAAGSIFRPSAADTDWFIVARVFVDSGTESIAGGPVTHPLWIYEGRVLSWGQIDRSIPTPCGIPQVGDAKIRVADTDLKFRSLFAAQTPRRRLVTLKMMRPGDSESGADVLYTGQILSFKFGPGYVELQLRDRTFSWIDEPIPAFINTTNFPMLAPGTSATFMSIIFGHCVSFVDNPQGVIALPHIGLIGSGSPETFIDRYSVAAHPVWDVIAVYRKELAGSPQVETWVLVDPSEYNVTQVNNVTFAEVPDLLFNPTYIDFLVEQPANTEIRADVDGIYFRGGWEGIPPAGYDPVFNPSGTPGPLRNPIDCFISIIFLIMHKAGTDSSVFFVPSVAAMLDKFATLGYYCDGALTSALTTRQFLTQFLTSFELDMYQRRDALIALNYVDTSDPGRPIFKDGYHILKDSFFEDPANPTVNRSRYSFAYNNATGKWDGADIYNNVADQISLGGNPSMPVLEEDVFQEYFVRDPITAAAIAAHRMSFLALGSYRQTFDMPVPLTFFNLELSQLAGLTHYAGLQAGGYNNREVKVIGITSDLDKFQLTVHSILRVPQAIQIPRIIPSSVTLESSMVLTGLGSGSGVIVSIIPHIEGCHSSITFPGYFSDYDFSDFDGGAPVNVVWETIADHAGLIAGGGSVGGDGLARVVCSNVPLNTIAHQKVRLTIADVGSVGGGGGPGPAVWVYYDSTTHVSTAYFLMIINSTSDPSQVGTAIRLQLNIYKNGVVTVLDQCALPGQPAPLANGGLATLQSYMTDSTHLQLKGEFGGGLVLALIDLTGDPSLVIPMGTFGLMCFTKGRVSQFFGQMFP